jgi:hypothetical protein
MDKLRAALAEKVVKEERQAARDKQVCHLPFLSAYQGPYTFKLVHGFG